MPKVAQGQLYGSPGKTKAASAIAAPKLAPANPAAGKPAAPAPAVSSGAGASYAAGKKTAKTPTPAATPAPVQPPSVPRNYTNNTTLSPVTAPAPAPAPAQNPAQAPAMNSGLGAAKLPRQSDAAHITAEQQKRQNNGLAVTAGSRRHPGTRETKTTGTPSISWAPGQPSPTPEIRKTLPGRCGRKAV